MPENWKKSLPFPRHWLAYVFFKVLILALATIIALRYFDVI